jgi:hypothetical protein
MTQLICARCGTAVEPEEAREHAGKQLCEDCFLEAVSVVQPCDPWAVHTARSFKGQEGGPQLTPLQQRLYDLVKERREVSFPEAAGILGLAEDEVRREFAVLRHLELLRGCKRGDLVLITRF